MFIILNLLFIFMEEIIRILEDYKNKLHYISVTGIIRKDGRYLICRRSPNEKAFPDKWCAPGGKIEVKDFINSVKDTNDHWLDILEKVLKREILEETGLRIKNIGYVSNLAFIRPNGFSTLIVSLFADYDDGSIKLSDELTEYAWVNLEEAKQYDLIENIYEQIEKVDRQLSGIITLKEYQDLCRLTAKKFETKKEEILTWGLGITGESGDVASCIKKHMHIITTKDME